MSLTIVPSIDLREGKVVRLKQGDYSRQINYDVDPIKTAQSFAAAGAQWMHIVDLDGAREGRPVQTKLISSIISRTKLNVQVGGGIRSTDDVRALLDAGAERAVIGTRAFEDWEWFEKLANHLTMDRKIVLAIDAREGMIAVKGWTQSSGKMAADVAKQVSDWPLAGLLYTDVAKDGMMTGPNYEQTKKLAEAGKVPVIASGGVGSIEHIRRLTTIGVWGAIVGRSLYEGTVDLREALGVAGGSKNEG